MRIVNLQEPHASGGDRAADFIDQIARLLQQGFAHLPDGSWSVYDDALTEVRESLGDGRISLVALDDGGTVIGWVGGLPQYDGHVIEIHPLVVAQGQRGQGVGRALIDELEQVAAVRGALTLWAGADDETGETSLSGVDLYSNLWQQVQAVQPGGHALGFYLRLGFIIAGVLPDANGIGKPDIYLAKRIRQGGEPTHASAGV